MEPSLEQLCRFMFRPFVLRWKRRPTPVIGWKAAVIDVVSLKDPKTTCEPDIPHQARTPSGEGLLHQNPGDLRSRSGGAGLFSGRLDDFRDGLFDVF